MKKVFYVIFVMLGICSCSEVSNIDDIVIDDGKTTLSVDKESLAFEADGGQQSLNIKSNANWGINNSVTWLRVQPVTGKGNGSVTVDASANTSTDERTGSISIYNNDKTITVKVTQKGAEESGIPGSGDNKSPTW